MIELPTGHDEDRRLAMLDTLQIGDDASDPLLDELAALARDVADAPIGLISLVSRHDVVFPGRAGFDLSGISRWDSFCNHAIARPNDTLWIEDAARDARFLSNPYVLGDPHVRLYAGRPIRVNGCVVGAVCVLDTVATTYDEEVDRRLRNVARIAEAALNERHRVNAMRLALEASADALIDCDASGAILSWSDGAERLFGYDRSETLGQKVSLIVPPEMRDAHEEGLRRWRTSGAARLGRRLELPALRKTGETLDIELWMSVSQSDGEAQVHANIRDISERKAQARELAAAKAEAEAANRAKTNFLANMSHELRTPLNGVIGVADLLAATALTDQQRELTAIVQSSSDQLGRLIADLLDLARIEAGELQLNQEPVVLEDLVAGVVDLCGLRAAEKGVSLTAEVWPDARGRVIADAGRLKQVLINLVFNAVKFTAEGSVRLSLRRTESGAYRFEVRDTGIGFRADQKALIFGRFQQADDTVTRRFGGTGLGLAISRDLVAAMGGVLDGDGTPGQGAVFWFEAPFASADRSAEPASSQAGADLSTARVLIVDDNLTNRRVAELILHSAGVETVSCENGEEALAILSTQTFDVVLMDMMMPVMDGLSATRTLRCIEAASGGRPTPVVMLTANGLPEHIETSLAAGADRHLPKPVTPASLLSMVAAMTTLSRAAEGSAGPVPIRVRAAGR